MSEALDDLPAVAASRGLHVTRPVVSRGWRAGIIMGFASFILFTLGGHRLAEHDYAPLSVLTVWDTTRFFPAIGGQWAQVGLVWLIKQIPGSSVATLSVVTVLSASVVQGFVTHDLVKRGWTPLQAGLMVGLTAMHPVMLFIATDGSPLLMYCILVSVLIIALDRLEAIGDTQSLILLGLVIAALLVSWPNALFFVLPFIVLLPWAFRDLRNYNSATALFVISLAPGFIVLSAVALGSSVFDVPFRDLLIVWGSPLHGADVSVVQASTWLPSYGGHFFAAFLELALLCSLLMPRCLVILVRFVFDRSERVRPVTGLAALILPPLMGALATFYWQIASPWIVIALSLFTVTAWAATVNFRNWERWLLVLSVAVGLSAAWLSPLLWSSPEEALWRQLMVGI